MTIHLYILNVCNINRVHETYQIDGYLEYLWIGSRMISTDTFNNIQVYENDWAKKLLDTKLWIPALEVINIQGSKQTPNFVIEISRMAKLCTKKDSLEYSVAIRIIEIFLLIHKAMTPSVKNEQLIK